MSWESQLAAQLDDLEGQAQDLLSRERDWEVAEQARAEYASISLLTRLMASVGRRLDLEVRGELADYDVSVYKLAALKGILSNVVSENVSYVNAPLFAEQRGIETRLIVEKESPEYRNLTTLRGAFADGTVLTVSGTLAGTRMVQKIVGINGHDIEVPIDTHHIIMQYTDRPGIVAVYGQKFGAAGINIAGMQVARREAGGQALTVLTVDSRVPDELLAEVGEAIDAVLMEQIEIAEV